MFALPDKKRNLDKLRGLVMMVVGVDVALCLLLLATASFADVSGRTTQNAGRYGVVATPQ